VQPLRSGSVRTPAACDLALRAALVLASGMVCCADPVLAQGSRAPAESRSIALELYVQGDAGGDVPSWLEAATKERRGLGLRVYKLTDDDAASRERFEKICSHYKLKPEEAFPLVYGFNKAFVAPDDQPSLERQLDALRTMTVFVRSGCPRCAAAKTYLKKLQTKYPGILVNYRDVATDRTAQTELDQVSRKYNQRAVSVPVFHFCNQITVGWSGESGTGNRLEGTLSRWTFPVKPATTPAGTQLRRSGGARAVGPVSATGRLWGASGVRSARLAAIPPAPLLLLLTTFPQVPDHGERDPPPDASTVDALPPPADAAAIPDAELPLPEAPADSLPLPSDVDADLPLPIDDSGESPPDDQYLAEDEADLALFGRVRASDVGMPLFTLAVGLVDGFNPCAMWVLLFLLSVLVNLQSRVKILAVAGSFVLVSGLAYFAFMAAWLNVISLFVDHLPKVYVALGLLAIFIGAVHIKDFFAFKQGITFSIPEAAKPGIYAHVRRIVTAENLFGAIVGAVVLAVLINIIELLCTAGLPALYTTVLSAQGYSRLKEYAYIGLYNLAYMFDDSLMVGIVVVTLGKRKLQEQQGRWLKQISGVAVTVLGVVMLVKPELLTQFS
jgi:glutaredoxin